MSSERDKTIGDLCVGGDSGEEKEKEEEIQQGGKSNGESKTDN